METKIHAFYPHELQWSIHDIYLKSLKSFHKKTRIKIQTIERPSGADPSTWALSVKWPIWFIHIWRNKSQKKPWFLTHSKKNSPFDISFNFDVFVDFQISNWSWTDGGIKILWFYWRSCSASPAVSFTVGLGHVPTLPQ